ncbi:hypothetical protein L3Z80_001630 [Acinetobacter baumannii]|nr:hypothetical protein [Acinetobacter baumannii]MCJ0753462.1 hypothetical protein [Acinetobacter baumannii]
MDILKFLSSFNTVGTYLAMATIVLIIMVIFFYIIEPK